MKVEGVYTFPGQPQQVWELLLDPESLRSCIPGVESLTETSPDHWDAVMKVGVAAIKGTYKGKVAHRRQGAADPVHAADRRQRWPGLREGHGEGHASSRTATARSVKVDGDGQVGGMLAGVGQRMLPGVAKMLMNQFFECLIGKRLGAAAGRLMPRCRRVSRRTNGLGRRGARDDPRPRPPLGHRDGRR